MPWCPKCKNEYVKGVTVCADCGSELVESLEEAEATGEENASEFADAYPLQDVEEDMQDGEAALFEEMPEDMANAVHLGRTMRQTAEAGVYEDSAKKAEEFKSGAYTLLFVGALGLAALGVLISGVLPVRLNPSSQWMTCLVMGALFIIFIVMGVLSLQSSKKLAEKAVKEGSLKEEMQAFCKEKVDANAVDEAAGVLGSDPSEMRYFKRTEQLKQILSNNFSEAESDYLDNFVDEMYPEIFGE